MAPSALFRAIKFDVPESIYFFTFHKCASTLFSDHFLSHLSGLRHRNYESLIYRGRLRQDISFAPRGYAYGPLRLSYDKDEEIYKRVTSRVAEREFVRDKICLFLVRDPRDILISSYHSFGFTHPLSAVGEIRDQQLQERAAIQSTTLDDYVLSQAARCRDNFACLHELQTACSRGVLLRYEDMIDEFDRFASALCTHIDVSGRVLRNLERQSRPRTSADASQHRRSGRTGQFRDALRSETLSALGEQLGDTLRLFGYEI